MAQMFHQSLTGPALQWFLALNPSKKKSWEDIGEAISSESITEFVKQWRSKSTQMVDRPTEKDQIRMITRNLQPAFAKNLVLAHASAGFKTFFEVGLVVEEVLQMGILEKGDSNTRSRKTYPNNNSNLYATDRTNSTSGQN